MKTHFPTQLKLIRKQKKLRMIDISQGTGLDQALISKFENGKRMPNRDQVIALADFLGVGHGDLLIPWMSDRILRDYGSDSYLREALKLAEEKLSYEVADRNGDVDPDLESILREIDSLKALIDRERARNTEKITQALELEYTFQSNRIEGNTLSLQETHLVIREGLTISGKSMREHLEALNHSEALDLVKSLAKPGTVLTERTVKQIHQIVLRGIDPANAGVYRSVPVMISGSRHIPPQPYLVPKQMEEMFRWYHFNRSILHPVVLAAEMHERLVSIHPFIDGNGRTSRLVMNLILLGNGYTIANIPGDAQGRTSYYNALENARSAETGQYFNRFIAETEYTCLKRLARLLE
ncbi:MAG: Fic family protein [Flavobacteriales bacterium]|nr:Fic family protein [Flavobacteriales bacterium]